MKAHHYEISEHLGQGEDTTNFQEKVGHIKKLVITKA